MIRALVISASLALFLALPASQPVAAEEAEPLVTFKSLTPEAALDLATATLAVCRKASFQVAVAVVDRGGALQVLLRDRFAGPHTPEAARRKAWTALTFRTNTLALAEATRAGKEDAAARRVTGALMLGGGVVVRAGGELVGALGVSGGPGGAVDEACALEGLEAVQDRLDF